MKRTLIALAATTLLGLGVVTAPAQAAVTSNGTITVTGTNDEATFSGADSGSVTEDADPNTVTGQLVALDDDHDESSIQAATIAGNMIAR